MTFYQLVCCISLVSTLLPLRFSITHWSWTNYTIRALFLFFVLTISIDLTNLIPALAITRQPIVFQLLVLGQTLLVMSVYYRYFRNTVAKQLTLLLICLSVSAGAIGLVYYTIWEYFTLVPLFVYSIGTVTCSLLAFYRFLADLTVPHLTRNFFFWVNTGFLLYYLALFISVPFSGYLATSSGILITNLITFSLISGTLFNILITLGAWKVRQTSRYL